jgi:hypothetical protein
MELQHLIVKIPVAGPLGIDPAKVVDVFHKWVAAQSVPGVLLVDVAELLHVPDGPGVVAVGVEADFALDHTRGIWGVLSRRKDLLPGTNLDRVAQAFEAAAQAAVWLEEAFAGALKFSRTEFELIVNDRGIAPNTPESYAQGIPEIEAALKSVLGNGDFKLTRHDRESRERFGVGVKCGKAFALAAVAVGK